MGTTLSEAGPQAVDVAEIVYHGEKMVLPEGMDIDKAMKLLERRKKYLTEEVNMSETFDVFPWDGAHALDAVLTRRYGWSPAEATPGFWGPTPPTLINIEVSPGKFKQVPWSAFSLPNVKGLVQCAVDKKDGRYVFKIVANILRKDQKAISTLFDDVRAELKVNSIYRGKAIKIRFRNDTAGMLNMPEPKFINTDDVDENMLVYPDSVQAAIETNLFTPIQRIKDCIDNGIKVKRGVILGGTFGTGKTLTAKVASKFAVQAGVTYVYIPRADELAQAVDFAKQYQSPACVIFCEDIDRALSGDRSVKMDDILNIIDGIDTKSQNIITILTTNDIDAINPAMLRPGRLDAVIHVLPPDAKAVERLIRAYGGGTVSADADLTGVGQALSGQIPAVIAEVVHRAKLAQLRRQQPGEKVTTLSAESLLEAADTMAAQLRLLNRPKVEPVPAIETALTALVSNALNGTKERIATMAEQVSQVHQEVC